MIRNLSVSEIRVSLTRGSFGTNFFASENHRQIRLALSYSSEKSMSSEQSSHSYLVVFHQIPVVLKYLWNIIVRLLSCELASPSDVTEVNKYTPFFRVHRPLSPWIWTINFGCIRSKNLSKSILQKLVVRICNVKNVNTSVFENK